MIENLLIEVNVVGEMVVGDSVMMIEFSVVVVRFSVTMFGFSVV